VVTNNTAANWGVEIAPDNDTSFLGKVVKVEKEAGTGTGYVVVEWYDIVRFVELTTDDLSTCTLGNSAIKDGATTVLDNFDAGATTGNLIVVSKSGTSGAGTIVAALRAA
jgi:sulfate adenylyltransferase subunit 1 (EFTu-like GTPase family)